MKCIIRQEIIKELIALTAANEHTRARIRILQYLHLIGIQSNLLNEMITAFQQIDVQQKLDGYLNQDSLNTRMWYSPKFRELIETHVENADDVLIAI